MFNKVSPSVNGVLPSRHTSTEKPKLEEIKTYHGLSDCYCLYIHMILIQNIRFFFPLFCNDTFVYLLVERFNGRSSEQVEIISLDLSLAKIYIQITVIRYRSCRFLLLTRWIK